jgi:hypothetical protein
MRIRTVSAAGLLGLVCLTALAQDPKTPLPADVIPSPFRAFLVTDGRFPPLQDAEGNLLKGPDGKNLPDPRNRQGQIHCLVCEAGLAPVVAIFARADLDTLQPDSGLGKLTKRLDELIPKYRSDKLAGFVMFLRLEGGTKVVTVKTKLADGSEAETKVEQDLEFPDDEKRDVHAKKIEAFAAALDVPNVPFGLAAEKSKALTAWGVQDTDEVTVIFYQRMRVVGQPWRFARDADLTDAKIDEMLKAVQAAIRGRKE